MSNEEACITLLVERTSNAAAHHYSRYAAMERLNMEQNFIHSSYRENLIELLFVGGLLRHLWCTGPHLVEVLDPQVDDGGFDVALQYESVLRHVQLKASFVGAKTDRQSVNAKLSAKSSGCVIWVRFNPSTLDLGPFLWLGGTPGAPLPDLNQYPVAKHTKGDSQGHKAERPNIRSVPKGAFTTLPDMAAVAHQLFGFEPT